MIEYDILPARLEVDEEYLQDELVVLGGTTQTVIRRGMRSTPKTGRRHRRGGRTHIASSPGNYPAIDTGRLSGSVDFEVRPKRLEIGAGVDYAKYVDPTRPFLERGLLEALRASPGLMSDFLVLRTET